jgi:hypothetical protein
MSEDKLVRNNGNGSGRVQPVEHYDLYYPPPGEFGIPFAPRKHLREYLHVAMKPTRLMAISLMGRESFQGSTNTAFCKA